MNNFPEIQKIDYDHNCAIYLTPSELKFWQDNGVLPQDIKEGDRVLGAKLIIVQRCKFNDANLASKTQTFPSKIPTV